MSNEFKSFVDSVIKNGKDEPFCPFPYVCGYCDCSCSECYRCEQSQIAFRKHKEGQPVYK